MPPVAMIETHPLVSSRPRTAVPKSLTATRLSSSSCLGWPRMSDFVSGSLRTFTHPEHTLYLPGKYCDASGIEVAEGR